MKSLFLLPLTCGLLCCAIGSVAHAKDKTPASQVLAGRKSSKSAAIILKPAKDIPVALQTRERIGEVYRLWLSINPTDDNDELYKMQPPKEVLDAVFSNGPRRSGNAPGLECYGFLKINDVVRWRGAPDAASRHIVSVLPNLLAPRNANPPQNGPDPLKFDPRKQGYSINRGLQNFNSYPLLPEQIYEVTYDKQSARTKQLRLEMRLMDRDALPPQFEPIKGYVDTKDDEFGYFNVTIDLSKLGESDGHYYWFWSGTDDHGQAVGSQLYLHVEHIRGIFQTVDSGQNMTRPKIGEKIATKKFPRGKPGPGPIIKSQFRKAAPAK